MVGQLSHRLYLVPRRVFHKTECFCFEQQILQPGEEMEMPMRFIVGHELPKNIRSINLAMHFLTSQTVLQ
ncbi:MAG: hypothetical protein CM15mP68_7250 [Pseudomonadota bacterium]|nr:MAG: hypothetical protein CM15mP68_7250 [Pseudomonadota bacterium]